jgi:hypothetical protein
MRSKSVYRIVVFIGFSLLMGLIANAQPGDPGGDPDVPITGIEILLAMGGFLGLRKLFMNSKKENNS